LECGRPRPLFPRPSCGAWRHSGASPRVAGTSPPITVAESLSSSDLPDERPLPEVGDGLFEFGLRVHHDRPVPGDRLADWFAREEEETDALLAGLSGDLIATIEDDERAIASLLAHYHLLAVDRLLRKHAERLGG